jgi:hypothetical protein
MTANENITTKDLIEAIPLPEVVRTLFLSALGEDGYLPNNAPPEPGKDWAAWLALANNLNSLLLNQSNVSVLMMHHETQAAFLELDAWGTGMAPLLKSVEPFGKWSIDNAPTTPERALAIARESHRNKRLVSKVQAENERLSNVLGAS